VKSTMTLEDGRLFPSYDGKPLSWVISSTWEDQNEGFPRLRAVIEAFREHRPEQLEKERIALVRASFDRMFGHNAKKILAVIEESTQLQPIE
jgi:hypothetical protein